MRTNKDHAYGRWVNPPPGMAAKYRMEDHTRGKSKFKQDRQDFIKKNWAGDSPMTLKELAKKFMVHTSTIRVDLQELGLMPKKKRGRPKNEK